MAENAPATLPLDERMAAIAGQALMEGIEDQSYGPFYVVMSSRDIAHDHDCDTCPCGDCSWCCNVELTYEVHGMTGWVATFGGDQGTAEQVCGALNVRAGVAVVNRSGAALKYGPNIWFREWGWSDARRYAEESGLRPTVLTGPSPQEPDQ